MSVDANVLREPLATALASAPSDWRPLIEAWRSGPEGRSLIAHVDARLQAGVLIHPGDVLRALALTPLEAVTLVILGQDPYHGPGQAHGLAFSVPEGVRPPPSLRNIFVELKRDLGIDRQHPDLSGWARQGVLLLNTSLTVEAGEAASHSRRGWEPLTESLLAAVAQRGRPCVYLLWGAHAQRFEPLIQDEALKAGGAVPLILKSNHPSPLSARRPPSPFIGCGHFSQAQAYLREHGVRAVRWEA